MQKSISLMLEEFKQQTSAGLLMYKIIDNEPHVFIGKLGGEKWKSHQRSWSIPKGLVDHGEELFKAAVREFEEETGIKYKKSELIDLGITIEKGSDYIKQVKIWAFEGEGVFKGSNKFEEEYPAGSGKFRMTPEIAHADFYHISKAKQMVHSYQISFLERLENNLK